MKKNLGSTDKAFRSVLGLGLLSMTFIGPKTMWGLVGIIPLLTVFFNFCPLYALLGINTRTHEHRDKGGALRQ